MEVPDQILPVFMFPEYKAIMEEFSFVPNGSYSIKDLNLPFPGMKTITIGSCFDNSATWKNLSIGLNEAHTHKITLNSSYSAKDLMNIYLSIPALNSVCIRNGYGLFNRDKSPSDLLWHEYGHVLDFDASDHGEPWQKIMRDLGFSHIANSITVDLPR